MDKVEIVNYLRVIFMKYFSITEKFDEKNFDKPLTGFFLLSYFDLLYIYILIENQFNIDIKCNRLENYEFNSINNIINLVMESVLI